MPQFSADKIYLKMGAALKYACPSTMGGIATFCPKIIMPLGEDFIHSMQVRDNFGYLNDKHLFEYRNYFDAIENQYCG